ncbi:response regulator transcription factor [Cellulosilyticum sp. ST5]|uniref:response regulator transcription factor n=1 Tax=Cellulosilyticum sp. ST5 TaxID=3055805 RepID=UPI00397734BB
MKEIYLVEDEKTLSILLEKYLSHEGYAVTSFSDGNTAMLHIKDEPNLWILDITLPGYDGYEILKAIKSAHPNLPVMFMSARNEELDRVIGLELGSDDYLSKPFLPRELVIRANKLLERNTLSKTYTDNTLIIEPYSIDLSSRTVTLGHTTIALTGKEFDLMYYLIQNKNHVLSREQILQDAWGNDYFGSDRVVDDTIRRLRKKMPFFCIDTIYGYGYRWGAGQ